MVITIFGLVATIAVSQLQSVRSKARDVRIRADLVQISKALHLYIAENGESPDIGDQGALKDILTSDIDADDWNTFLSVQMPQKPIPTNNGTEYVFSNPQPHSLSPFDRKRYMYMESGARVTGTINRAVNPTELESSVIVAPNRKTLRDPTGV